MSKQAAEESDLDRRLVRVPIYQEFVEGLFRGSIAVVDELPADARFVRSYHDPMRDSFYLIFSSEEFSPIQEGDVIPEHIPDVRHVPEGALDTDD